MYYILTYEITLHLMCSMPRGSCQQPSDKANCFSLEELVDWRIERAQMLNTPRAMRRYVPICICVFIGQQSYKLMMYICRISTSHKDCYIGITISAEYFNLDGFKLKEYYSTMNVRSLFFCDHSPTA